MEINEIKIVQHIVKNIKYGIGLHSSAQMTQSDLIFYYQTTQTNVFQMFVRS